MKPKRLTPVLAVLILFPLLCAVRPAPAVKEIYFIIDDESSLSLNGSSNVNEFSCLCMCIDESRPYLSQMESNVYGQYAAFNQTQLKLEIKALDCGHRGINKDLYNTLGADQHPYIVIELLKARWKEQGLINGEGDWSNITANTAITIGGVTKNVELKVRGQRLTQGRYRFVSSKDLYMTDFNIDPPKPLFGLIKVHDLIQIEIDLIVQLTESVPSPALQNGGQKNKKDQSSAINRPSAIPLSTRRT